MHAEDDLRHSNLLSVLLISGASLFGMGSAQAQGAPANEISPSVPDVLFQMRQMQGRESTLVDTVIDGLVSGYNDGMGGGDHVQGITMTASGRIVLTISRQEDDPSTECDGLISYSSAFDPDNPDDELEWFFYCPSSEDPPQTNPPSNPPPRAPSPEPHPSNVQATGEVIIVGTHAGSSFYHIAGDNNVQYLEHLNMSWGNTGRDASGVVYNQAERRFYAINAPGTITPGNVWAQLCRTDPGESLLDPGTRFRECTTFPVSISGQGSNLIMQDDGRMFLVSAYSTHDMWPDDMVADEIVKGGLYGTTCGSESAALLVAGWEGSTLYEDILHVSEIHYQTFYRASATLEYEENIGRTQRNQACVHLRPSFRFSGGAAVLNDGGLVGLWSGRQNPPVVTQTDDFEFAFQMLPSVGQQSLDFAVAIDCATDGIDNEGTGSTITATFYDRNWTQLGQASRNDISNSACVFSNPTFERTLNAEAEYVKISTDGSDAFMIDRILMYREGVETAVFGANNDRGWCLSTDEDDGRGSWEYAAGGICTSEHTWSYSNLPVDNPRDAIVAQNGIRTTQSYSVSIDCSTENITNDWTSATITATFYDSNWQQIGQTSRNDLHERACTWTNPEFEATTNGDAEYVKISTDGGDAFMIDRIILNRNGDEVATFGDNNDRGWCLSTEPGDGEGAWVYAANGVCTSEHTWSYSNLPVDNPRDRIIAQRGSTTTQRYSVNIDCSTEDITNDWTSATITATFYDSNWQQIGQASRNDLHERACTYTNPEIEATTIGNAEYVKISTDGGDAFMIDRIILNRNGDEVATFGANNDRGWCLSTEPGDGQGAWNYAADGVCTSEHTWSYSSLPVDNPRDRILAQRGNTTTHRYSLDIDCDVDDIENEGTGSRLTAVYLDSNRREIGRSSFQEDTNGAILPICRDMEWDTIVTGTPRYLQIHTAGSDGAMLDQIFVKRDGVQVNVLGGSNDSGWCLSTQESDAHGSWQGYAYENTCRTYWEFEL
jgi:hypothetical protein